MRDRIVVRLLVRDDETGPEVYYNLCKERPLPDDPRTVIGEVVATEDVMDILEHCQIIQDADYDG